MHIATLVAGALLFLSSLPASAQCTDPSSSPSLMGGDYTAQSTTSMNHGFYIWNEADGQWNLAEQTTFVEAESEVLQSGDEYFTPEYMSTGSEPPGGGGGGGGWQVEQKSKGKKSGQYETANCDGAKDFPPVVVTATRPPSGGGYILRIFMPNHLGGGGIGRVGFGGIRQGKNYLTCSSGDAEHRKMSAIEVIPPLPPQGSTWLVRYAPRTYQIWMVTSPYMSDKGIQPYGRCVG